MTERLADVSARIEGIRQLGAVVNAMKGIAAARARTARAQIGAVDSYAATVAAAMSSLLGPTGALSRPGGGDGESGKKGLLVFCAEQGFAGAFSERVLDVIGEDPATASLFLIGARGLSIAASRGLEPVWSAPMPSHTPGIPKLADRIVRAIYGALDAGRFDRLDVIHAGWTSGRFRRTRNKPTPTTMAANDTH